MHDIGLKFNPDSGQDKTSCLVCKNIASLTNKYL